MTAESLRPPVATTAGRRLPFVHPAVLTVALIVVGWMALSAGQPRYLLPGPLDVLHSLWDLAFVSQALWPALALSLGALLIGALLSLVVGVPLGILIGARPTIEKIFDVYVVGLYIAPVSALTPLFIYWLGIDLAPRVATVMAFAAPEVVITCFRGARQVPRTLIDVARAYGANERAVLRRVIVPHEIPYIMTAARLGIGRAIKGVVVAELLVSGTGLGRLFNEAAADFDTPLLIGLVLILMLLGIAATYLVAHVERAVAPWRSAA